MQHRKFNFQPPGAIQASETVCLQKVKTRQKTFQKKEVNKVNIKITTQNDQLSN